MNNSQETVSDDYVKVNNKGIWKKFINMCILARIPIFFILFYILIYISYSLIAVKIPQINGNFFAGDASVESVSMFIGVELIITALSQFLLYINHLLRGKIDRNLRNVLWGKILRLKPRYFDQVSSNTLLSRITLDAEGLNEFIIDVILELGFQINLLVLTINEMNKISSDAGIVLMAFLPITFTFSFVIGRLNLKFQNMSKYKLADFTNYLSELVSCLPLLKAFNRQAYENRRGCIIIDDYYKANKNLVILDILKQVVGSIVLSGPEICIILMGIKMLGNGTFGAEGWYAFYLYAGTYIGFCNTLGSLWENSKSIQGKLYKISSILDEEEESIDEYVKEIVKSGDIIFDHVTFAYNEDPVLKDVSFTLLKNKTTVIIGHSGSGKSTILKLLERMYTPTSGRILMSGHEIKEYSIKNYRRKIAFVSQNTPLMSGTIRENILYGIKREVSDEEIIEVCKFTYIDKYIKMNKDGLDYQIGQFGSKLSGGQRQKISIARAILSDAEILVLDEPTASLDIISSNEINHMLEMLKGKRTIIVVTHEAKTVDIADHIVAVNQEHEVVEGNADELKITCDFYRSLMSEGDAKHV